MKLFDHYSTIMNVIIKNRNLIFNDVTICSRQVYQILYKIGRLSIIMNDTSKVEIKKKDLNENMTYRFIQHKYYDRKSETTPILGCQSILSLEIFYKKKIRDFFMLHR